MNPNPIIQELVDKTMRELNEPKKPLPRSRIATTSNGYIHLIAWSNAHLLRIFVRIFTKTLPKSEYRLKAQLDDAARSVIANIEEGFSRPTTSEYLTFLGHSEASLIEVKGDIQRSLQDGFLHSNKSSTLASIHINLFDWHEVMKQSVTSKPVETKGIYRNLEEAKASFTFLYPPVDTLDPDALTYEIFIELINKTNWHLKKLVLSLEDKLNRDQKFYQVEKARVQSKVQWRR
jgi:four helix bundle protein